MEKYKGIIFNSVDVSLLNGELEEKVRENNIRTAVLTRKTRSEVKKHLRNLGLSVDVIIGGKDLNTRFKKWLRGKDHAPYGGNTNGAQAIASAIYLARTGHSKAEIKEYIENTFGYNLDRTAAEHRTIRSKDYICSQTGPEAIRCWLEADSFEQTIRNAVTLRTDADTVAAIAGSIAAATPGMEVPQEWTDRCFRMLGDELKSIFVEFDSKLAA